MNSRVRFTMVIMLLAVWGAAGDSVSAVGDHQWSKGFNGGGRAAVDGSGNVVIHGSFFSPVDFGGGALNPVNFFDGDQYLARFDADGNHLWSIQFSPDGFGVANEILAVDPAGNIYITGNTFSGTTVDYGGGPVAENQIYVAKFDAGGTFQWSGSFGPGTPKGIDADGSHVVVTGYTSTGVDFGGGTIGAAGGNDVFVAHLTATGAHSWSAGFGDTGDQGGMDVALDGAGNVVLVGSMFGTVDFGGGNLVANDLDLFLASYSSTGSHNWSTVFDGTFTPGGGILVETAVDASASGAIAVVGEKSSEADFGGGPLAQIGFGDAFVAVFDNAGSHQWSSCLGSTGGTDGADGVAIDTSGNILVTGTMVGEIDFGGGVIPFIGDPLNFDNNLFVAMYDPAGAHLFSGGYGPKVYANGCGIGGGSMIVFGSGGAPVDMGGGAVSPFDIFLARLEGTGGGSSGVDEFPAIKVTLRGFPNPFNPMTTIEYTLASPATASMSVFDTRGRLVGHLVPARPHGAGTYRARFTPKASGVYLVRLRVGGIDTVMKMVAVK